MTGKNAAPIAGQARRIADLVSSSKNSTVVLNELESSIMKRYMFDHPKDTLSKRIADSFPAEAELVASGKYIG